MKTAKIVGVVAGGLIALFLLTLLAVSLFVNPNNFKPRLIAAVKQSTGRDLSLPGDIRLSVFPWVALELGPASLGSPAAFGNTPFLNFERARVRVKLLPLLHQQLQIDRIELEGLDLKLVKNDKGENNWTLGDEQKSAAGKSDPAGGGPALQSIAGIKITHGRVSYAPYLIENFDLETGAIGAGRAVPVTLSLDASRGVPGETFNLSVKLNFRNTANSKDLEVAALNLTGSMRRPGDAGPMKVELTAAALDANLDQQTLSIPAFAAQLSSARLTGKLTGTRIIDAPALKGSVELAPLVLKEFAPLFGLSLPKTRDAKALSSLSFAADFDYGSQGASLDNLDVKLDDTTLKGDLKVALVPARAVTFTLRADQIDLDRYRPPAGAAPDPKSPDANKPVAKPADAGAPLSAHGVFTLGAVHAAGLDLTQLSVTVDLKDHVTHLHPLEAQLYGGRYAGDLTYDARTLTPALSLDEHLSGVDTAQLVANTHLKGRVSGKATLNLKGTARGADADAIMKSLNGHFDANLADGALEGIDVAYQLAFAQSLLNQQAAPAVQDTKRTRFDAFKDSAQIQNGVADTRDLSIVSAVLKVSGHGTVTLPTSGIDMTLLASVMKSATTTAVDIPLKITGQYTDPTIGPELQGVARDVVKQKINDVLKKNGLDLGDFFKKK